MLPPSRLPFPTLTAVAATALLLLGCDAVGAGEDDHFVEGVDFSVLFAEPTPAETDAVLAEWRARDVSMQGYRQEAVDTRTTSRSAFELRIVSHTVGGLRHYGAILVPEGAAPGSLPVLVYLHGDDGGVGVDTELVPALGLLGDGDDAFVVVAPSFRSEPLRVGDAVYASDGPPSPWDYDVDDALALLDTALETVDAADPGRVALLGLSRGAGVGLLMGARDPRIDRVVAFFGPTDFTGPFVQDVVAEALRGRLEPLPGLDYLDERFIQPLRRGELTEQDVRPELIRRSAVFFAARLPALQVHHGTADTVVPISQADALDAAMQALGRTAPEYALFRHEGGAHDLGTVLLGLEATRTFLAPLAEPALASR